jgi:hypothetical protein
MDSKNVGLPDVLWGGPQLMLPSGNKGWIWKIGRLFSDRQLLWDTVFGPPNIFSILIFMSLDIFFLLDIML